MIYDSFNEVVKFADKMVKYGTDHYGSQSSPMFASVIDARNDAAPGRRTPDLPGQRVVDRSWFGTNLMHDIPLIKAFYYLSDLTGNDKYREAVNKYLDFFCENCPSEITGLFPWGEHTFWHHWYEKPYTYKDEFEHKYFQHDHLRQAPAWFWDEIAKRDKHIVAKFGEGLTGHLKNLDTFEYSRHAMINEKGHSGGIYSFPRHGGFYILDWAMAYKYSNDKKFLDWIDGILGFLKRHTSPKNSLIMMDLTDRWRGHKTSALSQSISLALSIFETLNVLKDVKDNRKKKWEQMAKDIAKAAGRVLEKSDPMNTYEMFDFFTGEGVDPREGVDLQRIMPLWFSSYGVTTVTSTASLALGLYRFTGDEELKNFAIRTVESMNKEELPSKLNSKREFDYCHSVPARDYGMALNLTLDLYNISNNPFAQKEIERLEKTIVDQLFYNNWILAATGTTWYDSQLDPSRVIYSLVRLYDIRNGEKVGVIPDYQSR